MQEKETKYEIYGNCKPRGPTSTLEVDMNCSFHVGSEDWQSNPANVTIFARALGLPVTVVPNAGHQLPKDYVSSLLDNF